MSRPAPTPPPSAEHATPHDQRRMYEDVLVRAMRRAQRLVSREQAFEIAHDVAVELLRYPPDRITGALIQLRLVSRLRSMRTAGDKRATRDRAYIEMRSTPAWAQPDSGLEAGELRDVLAAAVAAMPDGMRAVFLLVREDELTYQEAAARLGVAVGTVHTQLSRANAILRECVERYRAGETATRRPPRNESTDKP